MMLANPIALLLCLPLAGLVIAMLRRTSGPAAASALSRIRRGRVAGGRARFGGIDAPGQPIPWRLTAAAFLIVLALARPQAGAAPSAATPGELLVAIDLSRSMLAADVAPSRLERARATAKKLAESLPEQPVGLLGFAGEAFVFAPPALDRALFSAYLGSAAPRHMTVQGTDFTALFAAAAKAFRSPDVSHVLVILSDGEAQPNGWQAQVQQLKKAGIVVVAMGFGTSEGARVPGPGGRPMLRDRLPVMSRLAAPSLAALAKDSGGTMVTTADGDRLAAAVRDALARPVPGAAAVMVPAELFLWPLLGGLLLLLAGSATELPARPKLRRPVAAGVSFALLALASSMPLSDAFAQRFRQPILEGPEPDPLIAVRTEVTRILSANAARPGDYARLAAAAVRYGEVHRGHGHGLSEGVLDDGLAAVAAGRSLDPAAADWSALATRLRRLREAPPPMPDADPGPADPANEPMEGKLAQPTGGGEEKPADDKDARKEADSDADQRRVGGNQRDVYDEEEWRDPTLIQPLSLLEALKTEDSPAELFRLMQRPTPQPQKQSQQW
jgi:Ca-activated chloride channel family protein